MGLLRRARKPVTVWSFRFVAVLACLMILISPGGAPELDPAGAGAFDSSVLNCFLDQAEAWLALPGQNPLTIPDSQETPVTGSYSHVDFVGYEPDVYLIDGKGRPIENLLEVQRE